MRTESETMVEVLSALDRTPITSLLSGSFKIYNQLKEERINRNLKILLEYTKERLGQKGNDVFRRLSEDAKREINRLVLVLDEIDEDRKVTMLSRILVAFLNGELSKQELSMYIEIVRRSFIEDIEYFLENADKKDYEDIITVDERLVYLNAPFPKDSMIALRLSSYSLVLPEHSMRHGDLGLLAYYSVTEFGKKFYHTVI